MSRPDEGLIHAWLDGELEADEAARVARLVETDAGWAAAAAEARGLIAASSRILGALDVVPGDVIPRGGSAAPEPAGVTPIGSRGASPRRRGVPAWLKVAAGLVLVAGVSYLGRGRDVAERAAETAVMQENVPAAAPAPLAADAANTASGAAAPEAAAPSSAGPARLAAKSSVAEGPRAAVPAPAPVPAPVPVPVPERSARAREDLLRDVVVTAAPSEVARVADSTVAPRAAAPAATAAPDEASRRAEQESRRALAKTREEAASREAMAVRARAAAPLATVTGGISSGVAGGVAAQALTAAPPATIAGCWRVQSPSRDAAARLDAVQVQPRIVRVVGDSTEVLLTPAGALAWVVRDSADVLRGRVRDAAGVPAAFRAVREACAP